MGEPARDLGPKALDDDPLLRAVMAAPMGAPLSEEERALIEEADRSLVAGEPGLRHEHIEHTIQRMRIEQGDALEP